jgi:hypothetical protein
MKVIEGKKYLEFSDFLKYSDRINQTRDRQIDTNNNNGSKDKLTLEDLKNYTSKTGKTFIKDREDDY